MACNTYLIGQWLCRCWLPISEIRKNNDKERINNDDYPVQNPFYSRRRLTKREKYSLQYNKHLSSINWLPW